MRKIFFIIFAIMLFLMAAGCEREGSAVNPGTIQTVGTTVCDASTPCTTTTTDGRVCRNFGEGYQWYIPTDNPSQGIFADDKTKCNSNHLGRLAYCADKIFICSQDPTTLDTTPAYSWQGCNPGLQNVRLAYYAEKQFICGYESGSSNIGWVRCDADTPCSSRVTAGSYSYACRNSGIGWKWVQVGPATSASNQASATTGTGAAVSVQESAIPITAAGTCNLGSATICQNTIYTCENINGNNAVKSYGCNSTTFCTSKTGSTTFWCTYNSSRGWRWAVCPSCDETACKKMSDYDPYLFGVDYMPQFYGGAQAYQRDRKCNGTELGNTFGFEENDDGFDYVGYFNGCCDPDPNDPNLICGTCPADMQYGAAEYGSEGKPYCHWNCEDYDFSYGYDPINNIYKGDGRYFNLSLKKKTTACEQYYSRWESYNRLATLIEQRQRGGAWGDIFFLANVSPKRPLGTNSNYLGYYNSNEPEVLRKQIDVAQQYGVDFFAFNWFITYYNDKDSLTTPLVPDTSSGEILAFLSAVKPGEDKMKYAITWMAHHDYANYSNYCDEGRNRCVYKAVADYWLENLMLDSHGKLHPNYLTIDGRPVIFIYAWDSTINEVTKNAFNKGLQNISNIIYGNLSVRPYFVAEGGVQSVKQNGSYYLYLPFSAYTSYQSNTWTEDNGLYKNTIKNTNKTWNVLYNNLTNAYRTDDRYKSTSIIAKVYPTLSNDIFTAVLSGGINPRPPNADGSFGNTPMYNGSNASTFYIMANNSKTFVDQDKAGDDRIIFDYAWNEWGENNVLEPTKAYGYDYLEIISKVFGEGLDFTVGIEGICQEGSSQECDGGSAGTTFKAVVKGINTTYVDSDTKAIFYYSSDDGVHWTKVYTASPASLPDNGYKYTFNLVPGTYDIAVTIVDSSRIYGDPIYALKVWNENENFWIDNLRVQVS